MEENSTQSKPPPEPVRADGVFQHVDPGAISVGRISLAIVSLVLIAIVFITLPFVAFGSGVALGTRILALAGWAAMFPVLGIYAWVWPAISYRHTWYCLKKDCFIVRRGVFWKMETVVPTSRIQHIDVTQGPLQRGYGISDIIIHTAGTRYALVPLGGLSQSIAPELRSHLLERRADDRTL